MKQKTATGAKDPRHLSSIAPTVAHAADATKIRNALGRGYFLIRTAR